MIPPWMIRKEEERRERLERRPQLEAPRPMPPREEASKPEVDEMPRGSADIDFNI